MKILFVEDDPMNRKVVRDMLSVAGADMDEAENAERGLSMVGADDYAVVLMDLRMPGMDGLEAIRRIRARGDAKAGLPIIVVTADTAVDLKERCLQAGADDILLKPVAMNALFDAIGRLLLRHSGDDLLLS